MLIKKYTGTLELLISPAFLLFFNIFFLLSPILVFAQPDQEQSEPLTDKESVYFQDIPSVYGASKYEQKMTEAPSLISIVTSAEIKKYGYRTLADILRSLPGFYVTYDRNYSYLGTRGFNRPGDYNSRVLLLIDGHRINDNVYDSMYVGSEFILDVDLIDRVEVIRGPGSSIYGNNAFFAVIYVITRKGRELRGVEVSGNGGSYETYKGRLTYGDKFKNGLEIISSGSFSRSEGHRRLYFQEFDHPVTNFGDAEKADHDRFYNLFTTLSFHDFTLQGAYVNRNKSIPTASFETDFNNPFNRTTDKRGYLDLKYEHLFDNQIAVLARLYYDRYECNGTYITGGVSNKDFALSDWWGTELRLMKTLFRFHKVTLGGEYVDNLRQNQLNYDEVPYALYLDDKKNTRDWAIYIQDEFTILKNLIFDAGVRYDHFETFGGTTNPRLGLIYNPFEKTVLKLLYGSAFRAPNSYELYYDDKLELKSNPNLKPESIETYEFIYEQYIGNHLRGTSSIFYSKIKDLIAQTIDPHDGLLVFRNIGRVEVRGAELQLEGKRPSGLEGRISYTFQQTRDNNTGKPLTNSPTHLVKFNLIVPLMKEKLFLGVEEQYTSHRKTLAGNEADAFYITNLTLFSRKLIKGLEASASVYNLFDQKYGDPVGAEFRQDTIRQDGRNYRLKLTYSF
jgi:outer membrane receptor for ferrienterochelin and colicins